jgi:hypothetical protein
LALAVITVGCITPYEPPYMGDHAGLLVVDGIITDGDVLITLSRSRPLSSEDGIAGQQPPTQWVSGAELWVESEDGRIFESPGSMENGEYAIAMGSLDTDTRYRLHIRAEGEEYVSEYRTPQSPPEIAEIEIYQKEPGANLQVRLDVNGTAEQSNYYMWNYEETWESNASINASFYYGMYEGDYTGYSLGEYLDNLLYGGGTMRLYPYPGYISPFYYCWNYGRSRALLIGSTDRLTENTLRDYVLYEIGLTSNRISQLYHTKISQYSLGEDAFYYFDNQKKNTDDAGSIFAPIPSEIAGNIVCTTSPELPAIGFVEVSRRVQREIFFDDPEGLFEDTRQPCPIFTRGKEMEDANMSESISYPVGAEDFARLDCIDCRRMGGLKSRPRFWPNDHQ